MKITFIQNIYIKSKLRTDIRKEIHNDIIPRVGDYILDELYSDVLLDYGPGEVSKVILDYNENECFVRLKKITIDETVDENFKNDIIPKAEEFGWYV